MRIPDATRPLLWLEFTCLYVVVPLALWLRWLPPGWVIFGALGYIGAVLALHRWHEVRRPFVPKADTGYKHETRRVLRHFAMAAPALAALVLLFYPESAFGLPREHPRTWAVLMLTYPVFSVLPQEMVYRSFFFWRYRRLVGPRTWLIALNAAAFAMAHLFLNHWIAVALTLAAGIVFSYTYIRTKTLHVVWLEHALYGNLLFTIGLGHFFWKTHL